MVIFFFYSLRYSFNTHPHPDVTPHCVLPRGVRSLCLQGSVGSSPQWLSPVQKWSVHTAGYTESRPDPEYDGAHPVRCRDFPPRQLQLWVQDQEWLSYKASQFPTQQRNQHHCRWVTAALTVTLLRHCPFQLHIMFCAICCGVNLKTQEHFRCLLCLFFFIIRAYAKGSAWTDSQNIFCTHRVHRGTSVGDILIRKTDLEDVQSVSRQTGSDWLVTPSMSAINRWVLTQQKQHFRSVCADFCFHCTTSDCLLMCVRLLKCYWWLRMSSTPVPSTG